MDKNINFNLSKKHQPADLSRARAAVVWANWFQFGRGETVSWPQVESRMLLWCKDGFGELSVNGQVSSFYPDDWLLMPWKHAITYRASEDNPFCVGGVHVIPDLREGDTPELSVAHTREDPLAGTLTRRDSVWEDLDGVVHGRFEGLSARLGHFASYALELFQASRPLAIDRLHELANTLIDEIRFAASTRPHISTPMPPQLVLMQNHAKSKLDEPIGVEDMAGVGKCSAATVHRFFQEFEQCSPMRWLAGQRMTHAARLLRTTSLQVQEVGRLVGYEDPFHFSRRFKKVLGTSPRTYRRELGSQIL